MERLIEEIGLVSVLVLIYIDDVLIVGRGKARVHVQAWRAVEALRAVGGWGYKPQEHTGAGYTPGVAWEGRKLGWGQLADGGKYLGCASGALTALVRWRL